MDDTYGIGNWVTTPWNNGHWFDGCDHDVILFDDVEANAIPSSSFFKRLISLMGVKNIQVLVVKVLKRKMETKESVYSTSDGLEILHNNFIYLEQAGSFLD